MEPSEKQHDPIVDTINGVDAPPPVDSVGGATERTTLGASVPGQAIAPHTATPGTLHAPAVHAGPFFPASGDAHIGPNSRLGDAPRHGDGAAPPAAAELIAASEDASAADSTASAGDVLDADE